MVQVSFRALKKYFAVIQEQHTCNIAGQFFEHLVRHIVAILSIGSIEACKAIFKCLQDFLSQQTCLLLFLTKHE